MGELDLIAWIRSRGTGPGARGRLEVGPGDDCAVLRVGGERIALATDVVVAGVHFESSESPRAVGRKALAVNLSDLAACGAAPVGCVAAVALGEPGGAAWARELYGGLEDCAREFECPVVGGDVSSCGGPSSVAVSVVGAFEAEPVLRSGAAPGQAIYVTGELGGAGLGRHLSFEPRLAEGRHLAREGLASAMIDLSDGLATDLAHVCRESSVGAVIDEGAVPVSAAAARSARSSGRSPLAHALSDGEDFELLFAVDPAETARLEASWPSEVRLTRIGQTTAAGGAVTVRDASGVERPLEVRGFEHGLGGAGEATGR